VHSALAAVNAAMATKRHSAARKALNGLYEHAQDCVQVCMVQAVGVLCHLARVGTVLFHRPQ